jgi:hypothetical protein
LKLNFAPTTTAEFDAKVHRSAYSVLAREKWVKRGMDREGGVSPTLGRLSGILEEEAVEGGGEMPLLQFFGNLGGWLHPKRGQEV